MTPDVNVLVAAFRADHPHHTTARVWLEQAVAAAARLLVHALLEDITHQFFGSSEFAELILAAGVDDVLGV